MLIILAKIIILTIQIFTMWNNDKIMSVIFSITKLFIFAKPGRK